MCVRIGDEMLCVQCNCKPHKLFDSIKCQKFKINDFSIASGFPLTLKGMLNEICDSLIWNATETMKMLNDMTTCGMFRLLNVGYQLHALFLNSATCCDK